MEDQSSEGFNKEIYLKQISVTMVNEMLDIVQMQGRSYGDEFAHNLAVSIIRNTIFVLIYNSLTNINLPDDCSPEEAEAAVKLSFATMKDDLQNAIADGFEAASLQYSGEALGYYCKILTAGKPVNTMEI